MSTGVRPPVLAEPPSPSAMRTFLIIGTIISLVSSTALSVLLILDPGRYGDAIGDLVILDGILWGATVILIIAPLIGVRPPAPPEPGPAPGPDEPSKLDDD